MDKIQLADKVFVKSIDAETIEAAIDKIGAQISSDLKTETPLFIGVLNGGFMFASELLKRFEHPCNVSFVKLRSYDGLTSNNKPKELIGLNTDLKGRSVVIIEDIVDTGITISNIIEKIKEQEPKSIAVATLFFKPGVFNKKVNIDYIGIPIPDDFIVGFGMDYRELGRNLKEIYTIK